MQKGEANIRAIAEAAGVSTATVSRALHATQCQTVTPELRDRVLKVCSDMHYVPNAHTQRLFTRRANTVAIIFPRRQTISSNFHGQLMDPNLTNCIMGVQEYLANHGVGLLLHELTDSYLARKEYLRVVRSKAVDGILIWGARKHQTCIAELCDEAIPLVMLQTFLEECPCVHVVADDFAGMSELVEQVIAAGHTRIGYAAAPEDASAGCLRNEAVHRTLARHGMSLTAESDKCGYGFEYGYEAAGRLLADHPEITCLIASNDMAAWGCIRAAEEDLRRVPEDLSVVGCDGLTFPYGPLLNSYYLPSMEIGSRGAELLLSIINGQDVPQSTILPVKNIMGNTLTWLTQEDGHGTPLQNLSHACN